MKDLSEAQKLTNFLHNYLSRNYLDEFCFNMEYFIVVLYKLSYLQQINLIINFLGEKKKDNVKYLFKCLS